MKKLLKKTWPIIAGLVLAAIIIFSYINFFPGSLSAKKAVTEYIASSMKQDVNGIIKYSSDYQKIMLYGSKDYTNKKLKDKLNKSYGNYDNIYAESEISFLLISAVEIDVDSDEYEITINKYEDITGSKDISAIKKVTVKLFIDGEENRKQTVYAVKSGLSWLYGF